MSKCSPAMLKTFTAMAIDSVLKHPVVMTSELSDISINQSTETLQMEVIESRLSHTLNGVRSLIILHRRLITVYAKGQAHLSRTHCHAC
jgi:hypothetical protein